MKLIPFLLACLLTACYTTTPTACPAQTAAVKDHTHELKAVASANHHTPKHHFALGYVPDKKWTKGLLAFEASPFRATPIQQTVDLSALLPPDDDQGQVGRCTGFGLAHALYASLKKQFGTSPYFSPNFIYYNERVLMNTVMQDSGAMIGEDGIVSLKSKGACLLNTWPTSTDFTTQPCADAYAEGVKHLTLHAYKVDNRNGQDLERALSAGFIVVYGITLRTEFEDLDGSNYVYHGKGPIISGHCMCFFKYNLTKTSTSDGLAPNQIRSQNQWGANNWGRRDQFDMPLSVAHSSAVDDCYVIDLVQK